MKEIVTLSNGQQFTLTIIDDGETVVILEPTTKSVLVSNSDSLEDENGEWFIRMANKILALGREFTGVSSWT